MVVKQLFSLVNGQMINCFEVVELHRVAHARHSHCASLGNLFADLLSRRPTCRLNVGLLFLVRVLGTSWYWARGVFYW
jgi:hypothetical protein